MKKYNNLTLTYSMQCSGNRGVFAIVQSGKLTCGGKRFNVHSMHAVIPGKITRQLPLKPSVPPSISGITVERSN